MAKKIEKEKSKNSRPEPCFSVHGVVMEKDSEKGISNLLVEVLDEDHCRDDRLGSVLTDKNGRFELRYEKEDFRQHYFEKRPDLYLQVRTPEGKIVHTTKDKVRYEAGRTEEFSIQLSVVEDLPPDFMEVTFAPARAKKDTPVKVEVRTTSGGNAYFSIFQLPGARRIEMAEDPSKPGIYRGEYIARSGDKIDHTPVAVVFTSKEGKVYSRQADGKISIDTHAPAISGVTLDPTGRFLFQLDVKLEDQLKAGTVSDKVLNAFVQKGIPLQKDARIETQNGFWWVTDRASRYLINRVGDKWRVYEDGFIVRNGESFQLLLRSKPKAQIKVLLPELDTEKEKAVLLNENPKSPGEYSAKIKISSSNKAGNGIKRMQISVTDAFGNKGEDMVASVELVNPEYASFKNIPSEHAALLEKQGIVTFAHLRAIDVQQTAQTTGLEADTLRKYQALASIQTIAPNPDVANALVEHGGYTSAAFLAFVDKDEVMKALEKSTSGGPGQNVAYTNQVAESLAAKGRHLAGMLDEQSIRDKIRPVNACGEVCAPESSAFSCFAYLAYLLKEAGFETDKSLRQIFGWNLAAVTTAPVSRIAICLDILRPRVNINHNLPAQMEYDRSLNERLIALTGKTQEQLKSDPVYQHIFTAQGIHQQNLWLEQDLQQVNGPGFADTLKAVHSALESIELETLIAQSGKTAEEWREQFYISFNTRECDKASYCQQAILVMQEYLHRNPPKKASQKLYLGYDEWLSNEMKKYYPENYYDIEFKRSLIKGEREGLKRHLKKAVEILDKIFVTDPGKIPSLDDSSSLMTSFSFKDNIYNNFIEGISMIENCVKVDDLMLEGHHAFFNEEYQLSRLYYFEAARKIRELSKKIRKTYTLIPFMNEEPETADEPLDDPNRKTLMKKLINSDSSSSILGIEPYQIEQKTKEYWVNLYISYFNDNIPGGKLIKGVIKLTGVDSDGKFKPIAIDYENIEGNIKNLEDNGWRIRFFFNKLDRGWIYYYIVNNNKQLRFWPGGVGLPPRMHYLALVYQNKGYDFTDYQLELECIGARHLQGVAVRWEDDNKFVTITLGTMGGADWGLMIGKIIEEDPDKRTLKIEHKYDTYHFEYKRNKTYKLVVKVVGREVIASAFVEDGANGWDPSGEVHAYINEKEMPSKGTFALLSSGSPDESYSEIFCGATFTKITAIDLTPGKGAFSDLAFFLEPVFPVEARGVSDYEKRKDKFNPLTTDSNDQLLSRVSVNYKESLYVINENKSGEPNNTLYSGENGARNLELWYPQNSDRLNRENLRKVLDQLPFLFIHQYFFILPVCLGDVANAMGNYEEASNWYRLVLNEWRELNIQIPVYPYMQPQIESPMLLQRIAKNYLDWANHLFRENTKESVHQARLHFKRVLDLMDSHNCCGLRSHELFKTLLVYLTDYNLPPHKTAPFWRGFLDFSGTFGLEQATANLAAGLNMQFEIAKTPAEGLAAAAQYLNTEIQKSKQPRKTEVLPLPRQALMAKLEKLEKAYPDVLNQLDQNKRDVSGLVQILQNSKPANASTGSAQGLPDGTSQLSGLTGYNLLPKPGTATVSTLSTETFFSHSIFNPMFNVGIQGFLGRTGGPISLQPYYPEYRINHDFCLPPNPYNRSLTEQACRGIFLIDHCFNSLGFPQNNVSSFRYDYLITLAKNYGGLAQSAEKDFIQFKEKFEAETLELMNASQSVSLAQGSAQLADLRVQEALGQLSAAAHQIASVNNQIVVVERRIEEIGSNALQIFGAIFGMVASVVGGIFTLGASFGVKAVATLAATGKDVIVKNSFSASNFFGGLGQIGGGIVTGISNLSGIWDNKDALTRELEDLRVNKLPAARLNRLIAEDQLHTARQQTRIAQLEAQFVAERAAYLSNQFFNPQLWSFLAKEVKKIYRNYLHYGATAAWLAQRALEFEKGIETKRRFAHTFPAQKTGDDGGLGIISQQYFQASQQGLLAAESLMSDIAALEQEKFMSDQRKLQITKTISLAQTRPLDYAHFLETGIIHFGTSLPDFDFDYPGHYQRRIKEVRINLFGLIGPEGIRATLTHLGPSQVVVREWSAAERREAFVEKTLNHPLDYQVMTNPMEGGIGKIALSPENPHLRPFEGKGVAGQWIFEMMKMSNPIDFSTITDIQLVIEYTALADANYRAEVLQRLPSTLTGIRPYSFCVHFSDACFHLKDSSRPIGMIETSDKTTGAHTLLIQTDASDFPPNQRNRRLKEVYLYLQAKDGKLLFVANDQYSQDLDQGRFTQSLQTEFAAHKITLAQNAPVATKHKGLSWTITDNQQVYLIVKQGDQIKVFDNIRNYANLKVYLSAGQRLAAGAGIIEMDLKLPAGGGPVSNDTLLAAEIDHTQLDPSPNYLGRWEAKNLGTTGDVGVADTWYIHISPLDKENMPFIRKDDQGKEMDVDGHKLFDFSDLGEVIFALHYEYDVIKPSI